MAEYSSSIPFEYVSPALVSMVMPTAGPVDGGVAVSVSGSGYIPEVEAYCRFGDHPITLGRTVSSTLMLCIAPAVAGLGEEYVQVSNNGVDYMTSQVVFAYVPERREVSSISPSKGPGAGGTRVRLSGTHVECENGELMCHFGVEMGRAVAAVIIGSTVECLSPAHSAGNISVQLCCATARCLAKPLLFEYHPDARLLSFSPSYGPVHGGTIVRAVLDRMDMNAAVCCSFGHIRTTASVLSGTLLSCPSPVHKARATLPFSVCIGCSTSCVDNGNSFGFVGPVRLDGLHPSSGPTAGGSVITLEGQGFLPASKVQFGSIVQGEILSASSNVLRCLSPVHLAGLIVVRVVSNGSEVSGNGVAFLFYTTPIIMWLSPSSAPDSGGALVRVAKTCFLSTTLAACLEWMLSGRRALMGRACFAGRPQRNGLDGLMSRLA